MFVTKCLGTNLIEFIYSGAQKGVVGNLLWIATITVEDLETMRRLIFEAHTAVVALQLAQNATCRGAPMTRRNLAFDAMGLADFHVFQKWGNYMFSLMRQSLPPGFKAPMATQLLRADHQAHRSTPKLDVKPILRSWAVSSAVLDQNSMHKGCDALFVDTCSGIGSM